MADFFAPLIALLVSTQIATAEPESSGFGAFAEIVQAFSLVCVIIMAVVSVIALIVGIARG